MFFITKDNYVTEKWNLEGFPDYFVADNNKVYHRRRRLEVRMKMKKYTKGFYLHRKFYSLSYLRTCLKRIN